VQGDLFAKPAAAPAAPQTIDMMARMRPYQAKAVRGVENLRGEDGCSSALLVMATGTGKTETFLTVGQRIEGQKLVLAHRRTLVDNAADRIRNTLGVPVEIEQGDKRSTGRANWIVASKDSLYEGRLAGMDHLDPALIIIDEAHRAVAKSFTQIFAAFPKAFRLGVTATPDRADEARLGKVFDAVAFQYEIDDGINDGWLVPVNKQRVFVEELNFERVKTVAGDLNQGEVDALMKLEAVAHRTVTAALEHTQFRKRGLLFTTSIENAELISEVFNHYEPGISGHLHSKMPDSERSAVISAHRSGDIKWLVNVGILTEGYDDPNIDALVLARPTKSRSLYAQMMGRGTRPLRGVLDDCATADDRRAAIHWSDKPDILALDVTGFSGRHSLIGPEDVLGGKEPEEVIAKAKKILDKEGGGDVKTALDLAAKELEKENRRKIRNNAKLRMVVNSRVVKMDPFAVLDVEIDDRLSDRYGFKPPTENMKKALQRAGFEITEHLSRGDAGKMLNALSERRKTGRCTLKQCNTLINKGFRPEDWSFKKAGRVIDELARNRWKPFTQDRIRQIEAEGTE